MSTLQSEREVLDKHPDPKPGNTLRVAGHGELEKGVGTLRRVVGACLSIS